MNNDSPRKHISKIRERLSSEGDPVRRARLPKKMKIAMKISDALESLEWNDKELAERLNKYSSEVSKWLKGDHNFTIDTLSDIEEILGISLLDFDNKKTATSSNADFYKKIYISLSQSNSSYKSAPKQEAIIRAINTSVSYPYPEKKLANAK